MGISIAFDIPVWLLVCLCVMQLHLTLARSIAPVDVRFYTLNMNLSIVWNRPPSVSENQLIIYTVVRTTNISYPTEVTNCVDISQTFCHLIPVFPTGAEFAYNEYFYVQSSLNNDTDKADISLDRLNIEFSPPVVYDSSITSRNMTVYIHGPETPYERDGTLIFAGDDELARTLRESFLLQRLKYGAILYQQYPKTELRQTSFRNFENGYGVINFAHLRPYTRYLLEIRSKSYDESENATRFEFRTQADAPDDGPRITDVNVTNRYCDYRDIRVLWEDNEHQQTNGPLTSYIVDIRNQERNETLSVTIPWTNQSQSAVIERLSRWHKYDVVVWAANEKGGTAGQRRVIEEDARLIETYKPTITNITELSRGKWELTWDPSTIHQQCILGYRILTTHADGTIDEETVVYGANASSAILNFTRTGRYHIDLSPIVNDTVGTVATSTVTYNVKGNKLVSIFVLGFVGFLVVLLIAAVIFMSRVVCTELSALPDISKSRAMILSREIKPGSTILRKPPEKEIFDSTKISPCTTDLGSLPNDDRDEVFQSSTTSQTPLLSSSSSGDGEPYRRLPMRPEYPRGRAEHHPTNAVPRPFGSTDDPSEGQSDNTCIGGSRGPAGSPVKRRPRKHRTLQPQGTDSDGSTKQQSLTVYIPSQRAGTAASSPSSSSDSGISATTYTGSLSDYAPSSPLSEVDETSEWGDVDDADSFDHINNNGGGGGDGANNPYVTVEVAIHMSRASSGNVSNRTSSTGTEERNAYKKIDSREVPKGYLPMNPVSIGNDQLPVDNYG